ncbi:MAG: hypothetical protein LUG93_11930 [Lachnospiraceae bacterium]|nr:hypothetical protein [Lachnospiraceae bacterium]
MVVREARAADLEAVRGDRGEAVSEAALARRRRHAEDGADTDTRAEAAAAFHFSVFWR